MKKFLLSIVSPRKSPFLLLLAAWLYYFSVSDDITGDLGRLGQIVFSKEYRLQEKFSNESVPLMNWCDTSCFRTSDIVFIGDSYSKLIYPDLVSSITQKKSAKFFTDNIESPEETFVTLCNSGVKMPKVVVVESGERGVVPRLCDLSFSSTVAPQVSLSRTPPKQTDFSTYYKNLIFNNHAVLSIPLRDSLFTCPGKENQLYFYQDDLRFPDEEQIQTATEKLDSLFMFARERNICFFYVVAADKYDVYQEFAVNNEYPPKDLLDHFSAYEENPFYVNTKHVLLENVREGVKDVYYADDTHWSPIGCRIVAEYVAARMDSLDVFQK
jgi:hypothetical protein